MRAGRLTMCRHVAFVSTEPMPLDGVVAPFVDLARHPCHQVFGKENPDGWGVGWYDTRGVAQRYRSALPIWDDAACAAVTRPVCTTAAVLAARLASPGSQAEETGSAPFTDGHLLFSLNGIVTGYHDGVGEQLRAEITPSRLGGITGAADSEVLFAFVLDRLDAGATPGTALTDVIGAVQRRTADSYLNLLLSDGVHVAATAWGNSLFVQHGPGRGVVASEPLDDEPGWSRVPDRTLVELDTASVTLTPL